MENPIDSDEFCGSYVLSHFNGSKAPASAVLCLTRDGDSILTFAHVGNTMKGRTRIKNNRLVGMLLSSMTTGDQNQMILEDAIIGGFASGFEVLKELNRLLLRNESNTLIFVETVKTQDAVGIHEITSVNGDVPSTPFSLDISLNDGVMHLDANLGLPLEGNAQFIDGVLQGELVCQNVEDEDKLSSLAKLVVTGFHRGYQVRKSDTGLLLVFNDCYVQLRCILGKNELEGTYIFKTLNGLPISSDDQLLVKFVFTDGDFIVSIADTTLDRVSLTGNKIRSANDELLHTKDIVGDYAKVVDALKKGLQDGLSLSMVGNQLTMSGTTTLTLVKTAHVPAVSGHPNYQGTYAVKCFKTEGNGLLFRIVDEVNHTWAFYNDTRDYIIEVNATFGSHSILQFLGDTKVEKGEGGRYSASVWIYPGQTSLFVTGKVNGFKFLYTAKPVKRSTHFASENIKHISKKGREEKLN